MSRKPHHYVWPVILTVVIAMVGALIATFILYNMKG